MKTLCLPRDHHTDFMNRTSCAQVHELLQSHSGDNLEGPLFIIKFTIYVIYFS